jgi:hypothetical protein
VAALYPITLAPHAALAPRETSVAKDFPTLALCGEPIAGLTSFLNLEQNDLKKLYRAKPALSKIEGTPRAQKIKSEFRNSKLAIFLAPFASLCDSSLFRFCVPSSTGYFKYLWL